MIVCARSSLIIMKSVYRKKYQHHSVAS